MKPSTLKIAFGELGVKEISGSLHNERILEYSEKTKFDFGTDEVPWCSVFVNWVALQAGLNLSGSAMARSWLKVGKKTNDPVPGDVVVFWRISKDGPYGHVGFFLGYTDDAKSIFCLGGNQKDEVNVSVYKIDKILEFRKITDQTTVFLKVPVGFLRRGDSNANVKLLQQILIDWNYLDDTADGVFGKKTETAFKNFQRRHRLIIDGIYGNVSRRKMENIINKQD